jgi:4-phytase/acid phosphatase
MRAQVAAALLLGVTFLFGSLATASTAAQASSLRMVIVVSRHGVRSPTHPDELHAYARQPWPSWSVRPGELTQRGATLMEQFGAAYRRWYGAALGLAATGCPQTGSVFIWADVDQRTRASGDAIARGFAPGCNVSVGHAPSDPDTLFDPLPGTGTVNKAESTASVLGAVGGSLNGVAQAYGAAFTTMEQILGCNGVNCKQVSAVPTGVANDGDGGLASISGGLDMAADVAENLLLEYTDGHRVVGWGRADHARLLQLLQLHVLAKRLEHNRYAARAHSSNITAHILQALEEGITGQTIAGTRIPAQTRFAFISGHDTQLAELSALLRLSWLVKGDQVNDTPPGSALIFELHQSSPGGPAFVRAFFTAQTLGAMRAGEGQNPVKVAVYVPGCPGFDCPFSTFSRIVKNAIDPAFVAPWK